MDRILQIYQPRKMDFGVGCLGKLPEDMKERKVRNVLVVTVPAVLPMLDTLAAELQSAGMEVSFDLSIEQEPSFDDFEAVLESARRILADAVIGIGGGSVMDVAKLVAAQVKDGQCIDDIIGSGRLKKRETLLICVPTTAGTGSEASPNAIFVDRRDGQKKGVISPELVPDMIYIDPLLTEKLPPAVTAATGLDALTHCIEAFTNIFAHPLIDTYALEGSRLMSANLGKACRNGGDMRARSAMALGSLYGGICLGPVNTAAVHALSYPLGSRFHIAHGLSNAVLLPHVMRFNLPSCTERYAAIARAMGRAGADDNELAEEAIGAIVALMKECEVPLKMSELNIPEEAIDTMAAEAMQITRLLKNNPRPLTLADATHIYHAAC
jgi:alcohol dehydrogenase class IV